MASGKGRRGGKRRSRKQSMIQIAKKFTRLGAYFAPEAAVILQNGVSLESALKALTLKSGFDITDGSFSVARAAQAWAPAVVFELVDKGQAMAKRMLQSA